MKKKPVKSKSKSKVKAIKPKKPDTKSAADAILGKKTVHKYDLKGLETAALDAYAGWSKKDSEETRTLLFTTVRELAYAILKVGNYHKYGIDFESTAYEYALYLFERVVLGSFRLNPKYNDRFPLQHYIRKNIKHIIFTKKDSSVWQDLITDLEFMMDGDKGVRDIEDEKPHPHIPLDRYHFAGKLLDVLRIYYTYEDIRRLLPISVCMLYDDWKKCTDKNTPQDIQDFTMVLVASAKKLARNENLFFGFDTNKKHLANALAAATRSTVFLSTISNSTLFPKELMLSLDTDSLYRLVAIAGGKYIRVPNQLELDTLISGVVAVSKVILEGKDPNKALKDVRRDLDIDSFSPHVHIHSFISKAVESYNVFKSDNSSDPLVNTLMMAVKALDSMFNQMKNKLKNKDVGEILQQYCELHDTLSKSTEILTRINTGMLNQSSVGKVGDVENESN